MTIKQNKVLLISPLPPPAGGIASWTKQFIEWSNSSDLSLNLVNTSVIGKRVRNINQKYNLFEELIRTYLIVKELKRKIHIYKPTVVHLNTPCGKMGIFRDYICAKIVNSKNIKLIVHYRCNIEDQINGRTLQKKILMKLANIASYNLVLNSPSKKFIEEINVKSKVKVISNFIDDSFVLDEDKLISQKINDITFIGHVRKEKGVYEIFKTAKHFPNIRFNLAGPLSKEIDTKILPDNVVLLGEISKSEVKKLLDKSDVFLFPTYSEGFANALLEAMARGIPVITTSVGANKDMIEDKGGIIIYQRNISEIVNAINALNDADKRRNISKWNIEKVKSKYVINKVMCELIEIYRL